MPDAPEISVLTQAIFRAGNDAVRAIVGEADALLLVCECGDADCRKRIGVTASEYADARSSPHRFLVAPGHENRSADDAVVVDETNRFLLVDVTESGEIAARLAASDRSP